MTASDIFTQKIVVGSAKQVAFADSLRSRMAPAFREEIEKVISALVMDLNADERDAVMRGLLAAASHAGPWIERRFAPPLIEGVLRYCYATLAGDAAEAKRWRETCNLGQQAQDIDRAIRAEGV